MKTAKIAAGSTFPTVEVRDLEGGTVELGKPTGDTDWKLVVVYRGRHCPLCTKYLNNLEGFRQNLLEAGIDLAAVSGDSRSQLQEHLGELDVSYPFYYGLSIEQMQALGLYISHPRSEQETDHPFPEPGLFVINGDNQVQVVDISNNPFVRPEPGALTSGLSWIRQNSYPIRGTYT